MTAVLRDLNVSSARGRIAGTPYVGIRGDALPTTGTSGGSPLAKLVSLPADDAILVRMRITAWPTAGVLYAQEDGAFRFTDAPDGVYSFAYRPSFNGVEVASDSIVTLAVGSAPGASLTGAGSITGGAATGTATAAGAAITGTASISAGTATGTAGGDAIAPGASLTGAASIDGGTVIGGAAAAGASLTGSASISGGGASGPSVAVQSVARLRATMSLRRPVAQSTRRRN